jgi:hypothetical protein
MKAVLGYESHSVMFPRSYKPSIVESYTHERIVARTMTRQEWRFFYGLVRKRRKELEQDRINWLAWIERHVDRTIRPQTPTMRGVGSTLLCFLYGFSFTSLIVSGSFGYSLLFVALFLLERRRV